MKKKIALALFLVASVVNADELKDRVEKIASTIDGTVGVTAVDLNTGRRFTLRGDERFPMASVYKFPIALALLKKLTTDEVTLDQSVTIAPKDFAPGHSPLAKSAGGKPVTVEVGRLIVLALGESDNTASDALLRLAGGPQGVMSYLRFIGINGVDVSRSEKQMAAELKKVGAEKFGRDERDTATPDGMVLLLRLFENRADGLNAFSRNFAIDIMRGSKTGARRIRAGVPAGAEVLAKTGTSVGVVNDVGIVKSADGRHRIVMAIFTRGGRKSSEQAREDAIAGIAREIYEDFTVQQ